MKDLKQILFEKAYQAEQRYNGCRLGSREEETWAVAHKTLMDLIEAAGLTGEYQGYRANQGCSGCLISVIAGLVVLVLLLLGL